MPSMNQFIPMLRTALPKATAPLRTFTRSYASAPSATASSSSKYVYGLLGAAALGGGAYYALNQDDLVLAKVEEKLDYQKVYNAIADVLDAENYDDGSYGPVLVRLAWHHSGTYDKNTNDGGSNGARMRFLQGAEANHGCNAGLNHARDVLEPIKAQFPQISYSDLWVLAGITAVAEMGGPMTPFRAGRVDGLVEHCTTDGRLPDGDKGSDHIRQIFYKMGFNDQEIVALSGFHALGRCHTDRSGFEGPWGYSPTTMSNEYFRNLYELKWNKRKWSGPIQMENKNKDLMMLTTDMAMITDKAFKVWSKLYASDEARFFVDASAAYAKLLELGVPTGQLTEFIPLIKTEDQPKAVAV